MPCFALPALMLLSGAVISVDADRPFIMLSDVIECDDIAVGAIAEIELLASPETGQSFDVSASDLADLIRHRVPGLSEIKFHGPVTFRAEDFSNERMRDEYCWRLAEPKHDGQFIYFEDIVQAECDPAEEALPLRYSHKQRGVQASGALLKGQYLGPVLFEHMPIAAEGDLMVLTVSVGPVEVQRDVWAAQNVRGNGNTYVHDADGTVLRVPTDRLISSEALK